MKSIKLSKLFNLELKPFLLGVFLSRIMNIEINGNNYFYAYSSFKGSQRIYRNEFDFDELSKEIVSKFNKMSGYYNWNIETVTETKIEIRFYVLNDVGMSKDMFFKCLYQKAMSSLWMLDEELTEPKKEFIRGFFEARGSVDTTAKYISSDYFYDNRLELKKCVTITNNIGIPIQYVNFNARNLQPQYVSGENRRNAQLRINSFYYAKEIGFVNRYKAEIFDRSFSSRGRIEKDGIIYFDVDLPEKRMSSDSYISLLNFYTDFIYKKEITPEIVSQLRQQRGLDDDRNHQGLKRDSAIIELFKKISPDKCAICGITDTFLNQRTGKQYFEIHHVISFCNGKKVDNIANLVKLCPTCHELMKKNKAPKYEQIKAIIKILNEHQDIYEFACSYLGLDDINEVSERIWELLG